ncbi:stage V sporulation protein R [Paenibacillus turicensis]|uniref:Stage V sporulation protein R n=1 Tax=Paenibacillus turicensis TaxID=160487 RepID=A0ABS4FRU0_9BACL|nr:stage V sporulation protein R [Paenibacillus turicensis]
MRTELAELEYAIAEIMEIADSFGLDYFPMRYEICPSDMIYTFGAYGMPTRFGHWSFGKAFHKMKLQYDLGLGKIYELVINSNPCYAFLLEGNSLIQNKMIVAHVLAHCDFFKNNCRFAATNRDMIETMSATAERIKHYELRYGRNQVEQFIDAVIAIQEHIDPQLIQPHHMNKRRQMEKLIELAKKDTQEQGEIPLFPPKPEKDVVWFIQEYSSTLEEWQRDIMSMLRNEMLYFWPQMETKIMNEGWASYWHQRIIRELPLSSEETIEYAKLNSSVVQPSTHTLNPYYLGLKIFEDIEQRYNNPTQEEKERLGRKPNRGRDKIFEVRELDSDTSFLRNHMTKKLVEDLDLYVFEKQGTEWKITDKAWEHVRDELVNSRINGGFPYIVVSDGNYMRNGELLLRHQYQGTELDLKYLERTLPYVHVLWGKTVHLETMVEDKGLLYSYDGVKVSKKFL